MSFAVLWDLDGTLADTAADIALTVNEMLAEFGLATLPEARVRAHVGAGAKQLVDRCVVDVGGTPAPEQVRWFMDRYRAFPQRLSAIFPGMAALVADVTVPQAIVTNKPAGVSDALLRALELRAPFAVLVGGDTLPQRKPDPEPLRYAMAQLGVTEAVMVGDGPHDVHGARAAGVPVIGVAWGMGDPAGADRVVRDADELREALAGYGAFRYR